MTNVPKGASLKNKTVLITGSTSGIGLAMAQAFAQQKAHLVLNGLGESGEIEETRQRLASEHDVEVIYHPADMTRPAEIREMVEAAQKHFGSVDVLINNAGIQFVSPVEEFPEEKWETILAVNLSSAFHAIKAVLPGLKKKGWGRILNIASAHGLVASPYKSAYVAAKHGIVGLTKAVALELAETQITCNAICPGYVQTPLVERQMADQARIRQRPLETVMREVILQAQPKPEFVKVEQLSAFALFLCSDAAAMITGAALSMDGGWTAR